ncbi:MAG: transglutaminase family protein [Chloroflexi bacterium]|nr:transglutaminase family protein [Chloroflexota bacterium]
MYYSIRHTTQFDYSASITESVMELYMQPRSENLQHCLNFSLTVDPPAKVTSYRDYMGNILHHFDIPQQHNRLMILAEAFVELTPSDAIDHLRAGGSWEALDEIAHTSEFYDYLLPGEFTHPTPLLEALRQELKIVRHENPFSTLWNLTNVVYNAFDYVPDSTSVDSPIDHSLETRQGVCQDFAHVMLALGRGLGIPCRYVSGYLYYQRSAHDRSAEDASHAWVEAYLPDAGWVGFDPTNQLICNERHIRVAVGRDYGDVPPTRGVFKGKATSDLTVKVEVTSAERPPEDLELFAAPRWPAMMAGLIQQRQQQQ